MTDANGELEVSVSSGSSITYPNEGFLTSVLDVQPGDSIHAGVFNQEPPSGHMTFAPPPGPTFMAYALGGCTTVPQGAISTPCTTQPFTVGFINFRWDAAQNNYVEQFTSVRNVTYVEAGTVQGVGPWIDTPHVPFGWLAPPSDLTANVYGFSLLSSGYVVRFIIPPHRNQVPIPDVGDMVETLGGVVQTGSGRRQEWTFRRPTNSASLEVDADVLMPWPEGAVFDAATMTMRWQGDLGNTTAVSISVTYQCPGGSCHWGAMAPASAGLEVRLPAVDAHPEFVRTGPITAASLAFVHSSSGWDPMRQRSRKFTRPNVSTNPVRVHPDFLPANSGYTDHLPAQIINNPN
ncbi:MAG: hypothetical protein KA190_28690 [Kofleriaceae bacterium]|nr:hypothetical protein [Kofleriaceae bacterium]